MGLRSRRDRSTSEKMCAAGPFNSAGRSGQSPKSVLAHPQSTELEKNSLKIIVRFPRAVPIIRQTMETSAASDSELLTAWVSKLGI